MTQSHLADAVRALTEPLAAGLGLEIWGVELAFGGRSLVRVYVERAAVGGPSPGQEENGQEQSGEEEQGLIPEQGVSVEQCAELSRLLGLSLEVEDLIPGAYILEVSSPGLDRVFFTERQLASAVGKLVELQFERPLPETDGRKKFRGRLVSAPSAEGGSFILLAEDCPKPGMEMELAFAFADIKKARQIWLPPEKTLPGKKAKNKKNAAADKTRRPDAPEGLEPEEA